MNQPRILLALVGDIERDAHARTKYGLFADALAQQCGRIIPCDLTLRGAPRILNAIQNFHPNPKRWRERFWKNIPAFEIRSRMIADRALRLRPDLILQIGVTFDATRHQDKIPLYIYTDYTAALSARRAEHARSPFNAAARARWLSMEKEAYQRASHIFVRSHFVKNSLVQDYNIFDKKITVCRGGVNIHPLPDVPARSLTTEPQALFIGKEFMRKGGDLLLQAFALALRKTPEAHLCVVTGENIPAHLPLKNVKIQPATWNRNVIYELYRNADLFVLPSRLETWGDVLLEAMAFNLPCIGVKQDAMSEIIVEGETGFLPPAGNIPALADTLSALLRDPQQRARMGAASRQRLETFFTWNRVADYMHAVIHERIMS
jgi:glycosyltransferase involved in cell wall biosynthesis